MLSLLGCTRLIVQHGCGPAPNLTGQIKNIAVECYSYKPSLKEDLLAADVVIGHAGAGTILESLALRKKMAVVINDHLMDNHQSELARKMEKLGHLSACTCETLLEKLKDIAHMEFAPYHNEGADGAIITLIRNLILQRRTDVLHASDENEKPSALVFVVACVIAATLAYLMLSL